MCGVGCVVCTAEGGRAVAAGCFVEGFLERKEGAQGLRDRAFS